jgi:hypothetical protein
LNGQSNSHSIAWWTVRCVSVAILIGEVCWTLLIWGWLIVAGQTCPDVGGEGWCNGIGRLVLLVFWLTTQLVLVPLAAGAVAAIAVELSEERRSQRSS